MSSSGGHGPVRTKDDRPTEADALLSLANEARAFGGLDEARESGLGDVHPGLDEEQAAVGLQGGPDLGEQPPGVGDLVGHPEDQGEIGLRRSSPSRSLSARWRRIRPETPARTARFPVLSSMPG
ncbi:MAG: hypothetical protein MZU91_11370 [Desulfosudis oleivorans]|nr:hypothetical protein [Desulfosudis oleivorans]